MLVLLNNLYPCKHKHPKTKSQNKCRITNHFFIFFQLLITTRNNINTILHFLINIKGLHLWQWWRRTIRFRWIEINRIVYTNRNTSIKSRWSPYRARCLGHRHLHGHYGQTGSSRLGKRKRYVENWKIEKLKNWKCSKIVFTILEL